MIYYFLPDPGIFGGVKVACEFMEMLISLGSKGVVVLPGGTAPHWFPVSVPVMAEEKALLLIGKDDRIMITWPPDYHRLKSFPGRLVCHCQGTDELMDAIFADESVSVLTCWKQAADYVKDKFNRLTIHVGISIPDCFFYDGTVKLDNRVAYMPRRGFPLVRACMRRCSDIDFDPLDGLTEYEVSRHLKQAGIFIATSVGEQFGLPALEAMAAGCLVLSVPVKGGLEYLHHMENCLIVEPDEMGETLNWITSLENESLRIILRSRAISTASFYRRTLHRRLLKELLTTSLKEFIS
jgi:glycosyltransferase involved in cell wall biosynthesis